MTFLDYLIIKITLHIPGSNFTFIAFVFKINVTTKNHRSLEEFSFLWRPARDARHVASLLAVLVEDFTSV